MKRPRVTAASVPTCSATSTGFHSGSRNRQPAGASPHAAASVTASFVQSFSLSVTKSGTGTGTVSSAPVGLACGATCSQGFRSGTAVTLTATPAAGSAFAGWSGGGYAGTATCVVTVNAACSVTATFTLLPTSFSLTV